MAKTQSSFLIKTKKTTVIDLDDFLYRIFFTKNSHSLVEDAKNLIMMIAKNDLTDKHYKIIEEKQNMQKSRYYYIIGRLKASGLIYKDKGNYKLSKSFSIATGEASKWWNAFVEQQKEGGING